MSNYPDPNYAPPPVYPSTEGDNCGTPKPRWFYNGGVFCSDVAIQGNLVVTGLISVSGVTFKPTVIQALNGTFTVLAA